MAPHKENKQMTEESGDEMPIRKIMKFKKTKALKQSSRDKSDSSDTDDSADNFMVKKNKYERNRLAHVLEWDKQFWKVTKPRYGVVQFFVCETCRQFNYKKGNDRFKMEGDRLYVTESLCKRCTLLNIDIINREIHHADPHYPDIAYKDPNKQL